MPKKWFIRNNVIERIVFSCLLWMNFTPNKNQCCVAAFAVPRNWLSSLSESGIVHCNLCTMWNGYIGSLKSVRQNCWALCTLVWSSCLLHFLLLILCALFLSLSLFFHSPKIKMLIRRHYLHCLSAFKRTSELKKANSRSSFLVTKRKTTDLVFDAVSPLFFLRK